MKKKLIGLLLSCVFVLTSAIPAIAAEPAKESIRIENNNKIQEYTTEEGENHTIYWAKGVDGPLMSGSKGSDGKYGDFTKDVTPQTVTYSLSYEENKGYYDLNKEDTFRDNRCYLAAAQNIIYWWLDQNSSNIDEYLNGLQDGRFAYNDKLVDPLNMDWASVRTAPGLEVSPNENTNGAKAQYIDNSYIVKNFYGAYNLSEGYFMDKVMDFFINGYTAADYIRSYENRPEEYKPDKMGGFFFPVFGNERLSKRYEYQNGYSFYNSNFKNWLLNGQGITIAYGSSSSRGTSHAISVWGAEYDEAGNLCKIYITDSNDASNANFKTGISDGIIAYDVTNHDGVAKIGTHTDKQANPGSPIVMASTLDLATDKWDNALNATDREVKEPVITEQPKEGAYVKNSEALPLTVKAEIPEVKKGEILLYQWYKSDADGSNATAISDALDSSYTPVIGSKAAEEYYYCEVISSKYGKTKTVKSDIVKITTLDENVDNAEVPKITTNLRDSKILSVDQILSPLEVKATSPDNGTISYQWYESTNQSVTNGYAIKGATESTFMPPTDKLYDTRYYFCKVTNTNENVNGNKTSSVDSKVIEITMQEGAVQAALSIEGTPSEVKKGDSFTLTAKGGSGNVYKLIWEIESGAEFADVDENGNVTVKEDGTFTVKVTSHAVGYKPISASVTVKCKEEPKPEPEKKIVSQFAPDVTKESGWYDTNKLYGAANDSKMCWAASCSNSIAWYIDHLGPDGDIFEGNHNNIYKNFRETWSGSDEGFDPLQGFSWYFTGHTTDGKNTHPGTGGYLNILKGCNEAWSVIPELGPSIFGNYEHKIPYVYDEIGVYYEGAALSTYELMSKTLLEQLKQGVCVLSVARGTSFGTWSHAITLWGADYDENTGLITKLYVTDSDDEDRLPGNSLKELNVVKSSNPNDMGYRIDGYYLSGNGDPITKIVASILLYKPENVMPEVHTHTPVYVDKVEPTCTEKGREAYYHCDGCGKDFKDEQCTEEVTDLSTLDIDAKGHSYGEWNNDADNHWHECSECQDKKDVAAHTFNWVIDRELTEELPGLAHEECTICGYKKAQQEFIKAEDLTPPIVKPEHTPVYVPEVPSTCTTKGQKAHFHCDHCNKNYEDEKCTVEITDLTLPLKDHDYKTEWNNDADNHWHECADCQDKTDIAAHTFNWIKDREPSSDLPGLAHEECTVCGYKKAQVEYTNAEDLTPPIVTPDPDPTPEPEPQPEPQPEPEVQEDEIKLDELYEIPDGLTHESVEDISNALRDAIDKVADKDNTKTKVFDVILNVYDNGTYRPATKEEIAARGSIRVVLPYPAGTNAKDYKFVVAHMATMAVNGLMPGDIETPEVTATEEGLVVYLKGLSPIMISYSKIANEPAVEGNTIPDKVSTTPVTGDTSNVGTWVMILLLAAIAVVVVIVVRKISNRKNNK